MSETFDAEAGRLEPPIDEIVRNSGIQGRKLKRRHDALVMTGVAGLVVIMTGATALGAHLYRPGGIDTTSAAASGPPGTAPAATATTTATATPSASPLSPSGSGAATRPTNSTGTALATASLSINTAKAAQADLALLESLLPSDLHIVKQIIPPAGVVDAEFTDGHGIVDILASDDKQPRPVMTNCDGWLGGTNEGPRPADAPPPSCTVATVKQGTEITVVTGSDEYGFYDFEATLLLPNDTEVIVLCDNGYVDPANGKIVVTRDVPPLTLAELQSYAADPGWQPAQTP